MLEQSGRFPKFKVDRVLTEYERDDTHLKQGTLTTDPSHFQSSANQCAEFMTTIKMNSSYLEVVDRLYTRRGTWAYGGMIFLGLGIFTICLAIKVPDKTPLIAFIALEAMLLIPLFGLTYFFLKQEWFNLTHNPIRFDRRNRMVYAFLYNKEVVAVPWDDVFFCLGSSNDRSFSEFDIRGHIMSNNQTIIRETFALGHLTSETNELDRYWDFISIYMDQGPETLVDSFRFCLPIADRKEPLVWGINNYIRKLSPFFYIMFPIMVMVIIGRFLAMHTSRTPVWPKWVEDKCKIDPNDPFVRDASQNPPVYPFTNHYAAHSYSTPYSNRPNMTTILCASIAGCLTTGLFLWLVYTIKMNM